MVCGLGGFRPSAPQSVLELLPKGHRLLPGPPRLEPRRAHLGTGISWFIMHGFGFRAWRTEERASVASARGVARGAGFRAEGDREGRGTWPSSTETLSCPSGVLTPAGSCDERKRKDPVKVDSMEKEHKCGVGGEGVGRGSKTAKGRDARIHNRIDLRGQIRARCVGAPRARRASLQQRRTCPPEIPTMIRGT